MEFCGREDTGQPITSGKNSFSEAGGRRLIGVGSGENVRRGVGGSGYLQFFREILCKGIHMEGGKKVKGDFLFYFFKMGEIAIWLMLMEQYHVEGNIDKAELLESGP